MGYIKQKNKYDVIGQNVAVVNIETSKFPGAEMLINLDDWIMLLDMGIGRVGCWSGPKHHTKYATIHWDGRMQMLHRLILPDADVVDHISRDGLDNRRKNMRACDYATNNRNRRKRVDNTSGVIGVCWSKALGKWKSQINFNGKQHHLGFFHEKHAAIESRRIAELAHGYICQ